MQKQRLDQLVSVIITTRNEADVIGGLLRSIKSQSYKNIEIILIDNNSSDKTVETAKEEKIKVYQYGPERSSQRNFGARKTKAKYLLFLDADMRLSRGVIKQCVELMESNKGMGGIVIPERSEYQNYWEKVKAFERSFYNYDGDAVTDAARFFRKDVFVELGGYDKKLTGPEDWDLTDRLMMKNHIIGRIKAEIIHKERIKTLFSLARKKFYYGLTLHKYLNKHRMSPFSQKTMYFLRPVFYKKFSKILSNPILSIGMILMFSVELISGAAGYIIGRTQK